MARSVHLTPSTGVHRGRCTRIDDMQTDIRELRTRVFRSAEERAATGELKSNGACDCERPHASRADADERENRRSGTLVLYGAKARAAEGIGKGAP